jgi:NAD(P)-dependent dehydrogenase (short-subunit alcohol dehydrogenase family)
MAAIDQTILDGRVALVTGGARGIGWAIAQRLHALGAAVVVADNGGSISGENPDPSIAQKAASQLKERAIAFTGDIGDSAAAQAAVELAVAQFGAIDIVVNNAAILRDSFIFKASPANWEAVLRTNLSAPYFVLAAATPRMRDQVKAGRAAGRIVNITSSAGLYGNFGQSAYASAKAGLVGLTRVVAMDLARSGVTSNAIAPFAATRVTDIIQPANEAQAQYKERALKVPAKYVAQLVGFLSSPEAQHVTGQLFGVRGRELFLFGQPRPVEKVVAPDQDWSHASLAHALRDRLAGKFTDLATDLDVFNTEPVL